MLTKLIIKNFQSHKHTELELHPGINCIVGSSDVGKTAILRAMRWAMWNRPQGDAFRSNWGGKTSVVIYQNEFRIARIRGTQNLYKLGKLEFEAIRAEVPEEIVKALNINEINLQRQFDRPFLLSATPGEVAQHFNHIAHLDVIDNGLRNVQSWLRKIQQGIETDTQRLKESKQDLEAYKDLEELDGELVALEQLSREQTQLKVRAKRLERVLSELKHTSTKLARFKTLTELEPHVNRVTKKYKQCAVLDTKRSMLKSLVEEIQTVRKAIVMQENLSARLHKRFDREFPSVCPLCGRRAP